MGCINIWSMCELLAWQVESHLASYFLVVMEFCDAFYIKYNLGCVLYVRGSHVVLAFSKCEFVLVVSPLSPSSNWQVFGSSANDEKEVALCIKDLNAPTCYPMVISIWVTDAFERKDKERDMLARLLVTLAEPRVGMFNADQLIEGWEFLA